jgi:hypothetical protein
MRAKMLLVTMSLAAFVAGCGSHHEANPGAQAADTNALPHEAPLPPQFAFIQTNLNSITLEEVTNRIGPYSRVGHLSPDSPETAYEFDLPDHATILVMLWGPYQARNRVYRVRFFRSTNDFHLYP